MNKVYTIGRDPSCDVVIADNTDVVSRVHASLKFKGRGKYILVDQGRNGTYVNGIKMSPNEEIPVTRKDSISFAHVAELDWNQIPKENGGSLRWIILSLVALLAIGGLIYFVFKPEPKLDEPVIPVVEDKTVETDTDANAKSDTVRDTVFIKEAPKPAPRKAKPTQDTETSDPQPPIKEDEVVDALI